MEQGPRAQRNSCQVHPLVYARHGHELMRCKSSVAEPLIEPFYHKLLADGKRSCVCYGVSSGHCSKGMSDSSLTVADIAGHKKAWLSGLSGSDRSCEKWKRDYIINGADMPDLHIQGHGFSGRAGGGSI